MMDRCSFLGWIVFVGFGSVVLKVIDLVDEPRIHENANGSCCACVGVGDSFKMC